jgi:hypothetical protein
MKRRVAEHRFEKNGARIRVSYVENIKDVKDYDCLLLEITSIRKGQKRTTGWYMRPDEAILIAEKLIRSVYEITEGYKVKRPKKSKR